MQRVEFEQLCLFDLGPDMSKIRREAAAFKRMIRAPQTVANYDSDWRAFEAWCAGAGRASLPADGETLALYVAARLAEGLRVSSLERHVASVAFRHKRQFLPVPDRTEARAVMAGARRQRQEQPRRRAALTPADMRRICTRLVRDASPAAARDRALLSLGFATGLRRSNLAALDLEDLRFVPRRGLAVTVKRSKTDQEGRGLVIGVYRGLREATCPVRAVRAWLAVRGAQHGPLFTRMDTSGRPTLGRLNPETVNVLVKAWVRLVGLDDALYGGHSLRAAFVTAAHNAGSGVLAIMERTGHKSVGMVERYLRNADPFAGGNPIAGAL